MTPTISPDDEGQPGGRAEALPELLSETLNEADAAELRSALSASPWLWPASPDGVAFRHARALAGHDAPVLRAGETALLTVSDVGAGLWHLQVGASDSRESGRTAELGGVARRAWLDARVAVDHALPLRWGLRGTGQQQLRVTHVRSLPLRDGAAAVPERVVDGDSFGLSFSLAFASYVLAAPLPDDFVASARVSADGGVHGVAGLRDKLAVVLHAAPRIRRFLVADRQADVAQALVADAGMTGDLEVVPVSSTAAALHAVFGSGIGMNLVKAGETDKQTIVKELFRAALEERSAYVSWSPLRTAAQRALDEWPGLDADAQFLLRFTLAVAGRHDGRIYELPMPSPTWLANLPSKEIGAQVLAHLAQHAADTGTPDAQACLAQAAAYIPSLKDASLNQLKLIGAVARLEAATGQIHHALRRQADLAWQYDAMMKPRESSYPLTEWFRLAGVCQEPSAFASAEAFRIAHLGDFDSYAVAYVQLARARSMVLLGRVPSERDLSDLAALASDAGLPAHLRWSATRWSARTARVFGRPYPEEMVNALRTAVAAGGTADGEARMFAILLDADERYAAGDRVGEAAAIDSLERLEPALIDRLRRVGAQYRIRVADAYPY